MKERTPLSWCRQQRENICANVSFICESVDEVNCRFPDTIKL